MGWKVDEPREPQGGSPAPNTETICIQGLRLPWEVVPGEDTPLTSDRMGNPGLPVPRPAHPHPPPTPGGGGDLRRPQITLRTVFNICKTATRAAKVNSIPGSSKVSRFKCFPFASKKSVPGLWHWCSPGRLAPRAPARGICAHRGLRLPHKYSKFLIKTYDCVNSTGWAPNLEKTFHRLDCRTRAQTDNSSPHLLGLQHPAPWFPGTGSWYRVDTKLDRCTGLCKPGSVSPVIF